MFLSPECRPASCAAIVVKEKLRSFSITPLPLLLDSGSRPRGMLGYSFQFYSKNAGMSYIMLSELPGELEAGSWRGKCL